MIIWEKVEVDKFCTTYRGHTMTPDHRPMKVLDPESFCILYVSGNVPVYQKVLLKEGILQLSEVIVETKDLHKEKVTVSNVCPEHHEWLNNK